jgi:hypothetical protein
MVEELYAIIEKKGKRYCICFFQTAKIEDVVSGEELIDNYVLPVLLHP